MSVHLLWAWQIVTLPDGYIPATVQEALLHVFMAETAASALLLEVAALHRARAGLPTRAPAPTSSGVRASTAPELVRAWKLWSFLPRMLLHRPVGEARIERPLLLAQFESFMQGNWAALLQFALQIASPRIRQTAVQPRRPTRTPGRVEPGT